MKTERRKGVKTPERFDARLSARVSEEAYQRLFITSVMSKLTAGEILDRLIRDHCRDYSLPGKMAARDNATHRANSPVQVNEMAMESAA